MIFVKYRLLPLLIRGSMVQAHPESRKRESCKSMVYGTSLFLTFQICTQFAPINIVCRLASSSSLHISCHNLYYKAIIPNSLVPDIIVLSYYSLPYSSIHVNANRLDISSCHSRTQCYFL